MVSTLRGKRRTNLLISPLILTGWHITDAGVTHVKTLKTLRRLDVTHTQITQAGFDKRQVALPALKIEH